MFKGGGLHRLEATIAPENLASRAVVGHLGFREEGLLRRYLDIAGGWKDHLLYALTAEEVTGGVQGLLGAGGAADGGGHGPGGGTGSGRA
jgi:ribosomal-protein-alanine N-acetyltransferase